MIEMLEQSSLPTASVKHLASKRSAGKNLNFKDEDVMVEELASRSLEGINLVLVSAGDGISKGSAPEAIKRGAA